MNTAYHHGPAQLNLFSVTLIFSALSLQGHFGLLSSNDFPTQRSLALVYMFPIKVISLPSNVDVVHSGEDTLNVKIVAIFFLILEKRGF